MPLVPKPKVRFTSYGPDLAHVRRVGERWALCGDYVKIRYRWPESERPMRIVCLDCETELKKLFRLSRES